MARRRCQYCQRELSRWAKLLHLYTCKHCAYRMSMGTSPSRPAAEFRVSEYDLDSIRAVVDSARPDEEFGSGVAGEPR